MTAGANPMELKRGIDAAAPAVSDLLLKAAREVEERREIAHVATVSAQDAKIGELIAEAFDKVGKDGVITVEESPTMGLELEFTEGMQFDKGYISPYFITDQDRMEAVLEDAYILLHAGKISSMADFLPLLEKIAQTKQAAAGHRRGRRGRGAVDAGREQDPRPARTSSRSRRPASATGARRCSADMAVLTGGEVVSEEVGLKLELVGLEVLGTGPPDRGHQGHHHDRGRRRGAARRSATGSASCGPRSRTPTPTGTGRSCRSGWPSCPAACACCGSGAATEVELKEKKHRLEDAISATRAAIEEGIIAGGGSALVHAAGDARRPWHDRRRGDRCAGRAPRPERSGPLDRGERGRGGFGRGRQGRRACKRGHGFNAATWSTAT